MVFCDAVCDTACSVYDLWTVWYPYTTTKTFQAIITTSMNKLKQLHLGSADSSWTFFGFARGVLLAEAKAGLWRLKKKAGLWRRSRGR